MFNDPTSNVTVIMRIFTHTDPREDRDYFSTRSLNLKTVPSPEEEITVGRRRYSVIARKMPLVDNWKKYGLKPPTIWAIEV